MPDIPALIEKFSLKNLPDSEVELSGEIPADILLPYRQQALQALMAEIEMPGFRKGHVPEDMILRKIGELGVIEESVEFFIRDFYPELIRAKKLDGIGRPEIRITKLALGNPVALLIRTAVFPMVVLPDYKKIASRVGREEEEPSVSEDDIKGAIENIRRSRTPKVESPLQGDEKKEPVLPEFNDEFVRALGPFENVAQFTEKLKEEILKEKKQALKEKRRAHIIEDILAKTDIEIPRIFVESELDKAVAQMKEDVKRFEITFEEYLKRVNKKEEDMRADFREGARKRAKLQLTLNAIAGKEEIKVPAEDIEKEAAHILEHWKDSDRERIHIYVESVLRNEKVLALLENF